jgi:MFS family permease
LLASVLFVFSYTLAAQAFIHHFPLWTFLLAFFFIGMGTSALYFSALIASAKNFTAHRGLSIAVPIAAFGLSSFWEALAAGSWMFTRDVRAEGGDVTREVDVVRLFHFFAILLGIVGVIGSFGLMVIPPHLPKIVEVEEATEEDALLPTTDESESSSVISFASAREELRAEHRPFLTDKSTYLFGLALLVLLGSGEMFINCVRHLIYELTVAWDDVTIDTNCQFFTFIRSQSTYFHACIVKYSV